jgi:hypothetical protein
VKGLLHGAIAQGDLKPHRPRSSADLVALDIHNDVHVDKSGDQSIDWSRGRQISKKPGSGIGTTTSKAKRIKRTRNTCERR